MSHTPIESLRDELGRIADLHSALSLMHWDQEVYMPAKAAPGRGQQLATLSGIAHERFTRGELGDRLRELAEDGSLSEDEASLVSEALYDFERATKLPTEFVERFAVEQSKAYQAWVSAREQDDFSAFQPSLEVLIDLIREKAELYGYEGSPYNALVEEYERGMTAEQIKPIFAELAERQSALVERIVASPKQPDMSWVEQSWDAQAQWDFSIRVLEDMGYDFEAGRQDRSVHPFTTNFDLYDVRVTTRIDERDIFSGLSSSMHEGGHALYEQGFQDRDRRSPLAEAPSLGIHESQSRMWENLIGRSRPFWSRNLEPMREAFPERLDGVTLDRMYAAINRVQPSLIRVEADECTYNLHVIVRFEIEVALMEGAISVAEIPEAWNAKIKEYLGLDVPSDAMGCLQDIHWSHGSIGYFPTYALGNLYASQLFEQVLVDVPSLWDDVAGGDLSTLLAWLREKVHRFGRRKVATEIVRDATGREPDSAAYLRYLETKYGELYGV